MITFQDIQQIAKETPPLVTNSSKNLSKRGRGRPSRKARRITTDIVETPESINTLDTPVAPATTESKPKRQKTSKGTTTVEPQFVCERCTGKRYDLLSHLPTREYYGVLSDGRAFTHIKRDRIRCSKCGQCDILVSYIFLAQEKE